MNEKVICAAVYYDDSKERTHLPRNLKTGFVIGGWRHVNCIYQFSETFFPNWQTDEQHKAIRLHYLNVTSLARRCGLRKNKISNLKQI